MINWMKHRIRSWLYDYHCRNNAALPFAHTHYSQDGEDIFLSELFAKKEHGLYVDVGAHHPFRFSNTYLFYLKGWSGVNIDANPGAMELFRKYRPRDINIEAAISNESGTGVFYLFREPALNGFDGPVVKKYVSEGNQLLGTCEIPFISLKKILDKSLAPGAEIDFLSMDIEGSELTALKSNDWAKYRPKIMLIEQDEKLTYREVLDTAVANYIFGHGYELYFRFHRTCVYLRKS